MNELFREIKREIREIQGTTVYVFVNRYIADLLLEEERFEFDELERKYGKRIIVKVRDNFHQEQFEVRGKSFDISKV